MGNTPFLGVQRQPAAGANGGSLHPANIREKTRDNHNIPDGQVKPGASRAVLIGNGRQPLKQGWFQAGRG